MNDGDGSHYQFSLADGTTVKNMEWLYLTTGSGDDKVTFTNTNFNPQSPGSGQYWEGSDGVDTAVVDFSSFSEGVTSGDYYNVYRIGVGGLSYPYNGGYQYQVDLSHIENVTVLGGTGDDRLAGGSGSNDTLSGGAGNDYLQSSGGTDTLLGGDGDDTISVTGEGTVTIDDGAGADIVYGFIAGVDSKAKLDLSRLPTIHTLSDVLALGVQDGSDAFFDFGNNDTLKLANVLLTDLIADNLKFDSNAAPCFAAGTRLLTDHGDKAVEDLMEGDFVIVHSACGMRKVRWIGHRRVRLTAHPRPWDVQPVRICRDAFGEGLPNRDLRLSPDHAVYVDGVLIPIRYLVNGATIVQENVPEVTYYHVELATTDGRAVHDVVLAQGLPTESYLDTGNRAAFVNDGSVVQAHPDFAREAWERGCAPLVLEGPVVEATRVSLVAQATVLGHVLSADPGLHLVVDGSVVEAERDGDNYCFKLPRRARDVRLVSRTTVPAETRPDSSDGRRLGVAVTRLVLDGRPLTLDDARLAGGWQGSEGDWRWTAGSAALSIAGSQVLEVTIASLECYWIRTAALVRRGRTAAV
ncbi:MAG: Hint domain-containing protein [Acetobacteraceae bacterium]|nr:Hint domain-containing protein [Acetobacteraceae bacterium]